MFFVVYLLVVLLLLLGLLFVVCLLLIFVVGCCFLFVGVGGVDFVAGVSYWSDLRSYDIYLNNIMFFK